MPTLLFDSLRLLILIVLISFRMEFSKKVQKITQLTVKEPYLDKKRSENLHAYVYFIACVY